MNDNWVTVQQYAKTLGIVPNTVQSRIKRGTIQSKRVGGRRWVDPTHDTTVPRKVRSAQTRTNGSVVHATAGDADLVLITVTLSVTPEFRDSLVSRGLQAMLEEMLTEAS